MQPDHEEESSPCYAWYPGDWRACRFVRDMSWKERGFYRECLDWAWELNGLPNDLEVIRVTLSCSVRDFSKLWPCISHVFSVSSDGRLRNNRQEKERAKQTKWKQRAISAGEARATNGSRDVQGRFAVKDDTPPVEVLAPTPASVQHPLPASHQLPVPAALVLALAPALVPVHVRAPVLAPEDAARVLEVYQAHWKTHYGHESSLMLTPLQQMQLEQQVAAHSAARLIEAVAAYFATTDGYVRQAKHALPLWLRDPLKYLATAKTETPAPVRQKSSLEIINAARLADGRPLLGGK